MAPVVGGAIDVAVLVVVVVVVVVAVELVAVIVVAAVAAVADAGVVVDEVFDGGTANETCCVGLAAPTTADVVTSPLNEVLR